jgi:MoaA/NifB/PqqE/SkfB family radical SAM enzyme
VAIVDQPVRSADLALLRIVDVELTNRCNASCGFCPRDATPHQGLMTTRVLERTLARVLEVRAQAGANWPICDGVSFCGLGDQLLHPKVADYVRLVRDAGLDVAVNTNAHLLDADRAGAILDAGATSVFVNAGEIGEAYDELYHLPFERMRANVQRFAMMAEGRCDLYLVLVDHAGDAAHVEQVQEFWRAQGVRRFYHLDLLNRAGTLPVEGMDYARLPHMAEARARLAARPAEHACRAPFAFPFIGYDGNYYLCGSDWQKEVVAGNVFEHSILEVVGPKLAHVRSDSAICRGCNHDPANRLATMLSDRDQGLTTPAMVDSFVDALDADTAELEAVVARVGELLAAPGPRLAPVAPPSARGRSLIPVVASDRAC